MKLTVHDLAFALSEEFRRDLWKLVDTRSFKNPPRAASFHEDRGLWELLERVVDKLNKIGNNQPSITQTINETGGYNLLKKGYEPAEVDTTPVSPKPGSQAIRDAGETARRVLVPVPEDAPITDPDYGF